MDLELGSPDRMILDADLDDCGDDCNLIRPLQGSLDSSPSSDLDIQIAFEEINPRTESKRKRRQYTYDSSCNTFHDLYEIRDDLLGQGAVSSVHTCAERASGNEYAVKIVQKRSYEHRKRILREVEILHMCQDHRHVVQLRQFFEASDCFYLVFRKVDGGPLLERIREHKCFTESQAREAVVEIAEVLKFLHHKGIAHRDLKPANILCESPDKVTPVRICDFDLGSGFSSYESPVATPLLGTPVGSAEFMAPEVIATFDNEGLTYDKKCDMWSLGVILYIMLSGKPPFYANCGSPDCTWDEGGYCESCQTILMDTIQDGTFDFPEEDWMGVSELAKDLISCLLVRCPRRRYTAAEVLEHPWMHTKMETSMEEPLETTRNLNRSNSVPGLIRQVMSDAVHFQRLFLNNVYSLDGVACSPVTSHLHSPVGDEPTMSAVLNSKLAQRRYHHSSPPK